MDAAALDDLRARVTSHLAHASSTPVEVHKLTPLAGGACQDNVRVDATIAGAKHAFVLRADALRSLPGSLDRRAELAVIEAAVAAGVKTPRARWLASDLTRTGAHAYFLEWAEGVAIGRKVTADPALEAARKKLPRELVAELAKIHTITPDKRAGLLPPLAVPGDPVASVLAWVRDMIDRLPERRPALELAYAWLDEQRPSERTVALVHGDFRTGNFLVTPAGLSAVLDWEFAHWGSPLEDLAWLCVRDWRFGRLELAAGGIFHRTELLELYREITGRAIGLEELRWWEVLGNARWAAGAAFQGTRAVAGAEDELELLAIARRAPEMEFEALRLIVGQPPEREPGERAVNKSPPEEAILLDALARFLESAVKPALADPALGYRALVGASLARSVAATLRQPSRLAGDKVVVEALERLRGGQKLPTEVLDRTLRFVLANLRVTLAATSPKFDPEAKVE